MNLSSLSSQLNMSIQELRVKANAKGFKIAPRANKVDNYLAKEIFEALGEKKQEAPKDTVPKKVKLPAFIKVRDFALALDKPVTEVIKVLIKNGVMATINEEVDFDTASIVAQDLGFEVGEETDKDKKEFGIGFLQEVLKAEKEENIKYRPPIVAIMGHVDHGKTTLLDTIRKTKVAEGESGGITQHIGAYQIKKEGKIITFLDTPGHEAFSEMRARGANVTDLIVLVVAADDGVRPQTLEVINRAKFTQTPLIVAINKIDKPEANVTRVKQELAGHEVLTEEWGGKTVAVEISAKQNQGIDQLLEMILLQAEMENFKANPKGKTIGTIIESRLSQGKGAVATVIVQNGTLKPGDIIAAGGTYGRIRSMEDYTGKKLKEAPPSTPALISGLSEVPQAGDILQTTETLDEAKNIALSIKKRTRSHRLIAKKAIEGDALSKTLNLILKTDVAGSLEAIKQSLEKLKNDEVKLNILNEGVGEVNESDVLMAEGAKANVIAFRTKINSKAIALAKQKKVVIDTYDVIYELIEDVTSAIIKLFTPEMEKTVVGKAKVLAIFRTEKEQMIVGGKVEEGQIKKQGKIGIYRDGQELGTAGITELQHNKVVSKDVPVGQEFGTKLKTKVKIQEGDLLECFEEKLKQKTL
ncbi:MAG: translation initiation factor IF-2 [Candidatus Doudnabacteria bacterium CG10_big_fil_rev_8_21_14_0_10_42_18]|uniref:Translation initiation factor IF-2 n=1 Tax=Candidatus Doudnabacteria bacterium CG10_big_fil_rev_8_21_14_0_10_42_18 TaxID=1974552 RepID=A0A2H0VCV9_9BACT|nr:MAG: translation initiation factor IF-2 [Candidatus Doudnabacteria bacterium CG10_big_fil_rev_8_21_14_0_10_42_18]